MKASNNRLWKLLADKDMKKKELREIAGISSFLICKLHRGENITMDVPGKICNALNFTLNDICEFEEHDI